MLPFCIVLNAYAEVQNSSVAQQTTMSSSSAIMQKLDQFTEISQEIGQVQPCQLKSPRQVLSRFSTSRRQIRNRFLTKCLLKKIGNLVADKIYLMEFNYNEKRKTKVVSTFYNRL